jgi:hypothetical protein
MANHPASAVLSEDGSGQAWAPASSPGGVLTLPPGTCCVLPVKARISSARAEPTMQWPSSSNKRATSNGPVQDRLASPCSDLRDRQCAEMISSSGMTQVDTHDAAAACGDARECPPGQRLSPTAAHCRPRTVSASRKAARRPRARLTARSDRVARASEAAAVVSVLVSFAPVRRSSPTDR